MKQYVLVTAARDEEKYIDRLKSDAAFFENEQAKWIKAKDRHDNYLFAPPLKDEWRNCLLPLGIGGFWMAMADLFTNPIVNFFGGVNVLYGLGCIAAKPFLPTVAEYDERTRELNRIREKYGFSRRKK